MQTKQLAVSMIMAVCYGAETMEYNWDGPEVTSGDKTLTATGSTDWAVSGEGEERKLTRYMTHTLTFEDDTQELEKNIEQAQVYTCLPDLDKEEGYWCFVNQFGHFGDSSLIYFMAFQNSSADELPEFTSQVFAIDDLLGETGTAMNSVYSWTKELDGDAEVEAVALVE